MWLRLIGTRRTWVLVVAHRIRDRRGLRDRLGIGFVGREVRAVERRRLRQALGECGEFGRVLLGHEAFEEDVHLGFERRDPAVDTLDLALDAGGVLLDLLFELGLPLRHAMLGLLADPGDFGLRPFADRRDIVVGALAEGGGFGGRIRRGSARRTSSLRSATWRIVCSRAAPAAVCIAFVRSARNFEGLRCAFAGAAALRCPARAHRRPSFVRRVVGRLVLAALGVRRRIASWCLSAGRSSRGAESRSLYPSPCRNLSSPAWTWGFVGSLGVSKCYGRRALGGLPPEVPSGRGSSTVGRPSQPPGRCLPAQALVYSATSGGDAERAEYHDRVDLSQPVDRFRRPLHDLRISVTDRCNFRCVYCMPKEVYGRDYAFMPRDMVLSFEEIERLAVVFVGLGVEKLRITGGEPLVRRGLPALIACSPRFGRLRARRSTSR